MDSRKKNTRKPSGSRTRRAKECPIIDFPDYGGDGRIYRFPALGLCITGADSFEEAKRIAEETSEQMRMDGFEWDPVEGEFVPIDGEVPFDDGIIPIEKWFTI